MKKIVTYLLITIIPVFVAAIIIWKVTAQPPTGPGFSVMTFNIGDRIKDPANLPATEEIVKVIREIGIPDILLVQESPWKVKMDDLAESLGFAHHVSARPRFFSSTSNSAIFSRYPLNNPHSIPFESRPNRSMALCAEALIAGKKIMLCSVQLSTLRFELDRRIEDGEEKIPGVLRIMGNEIFRETAHSRNVDSLMAWVNSQTADAAILGGDFNTFILSKSIRTVSRYFDDSLWPSIDYFRGTYQKFRFLVKPRIDFLFHNGKIACLDAAIIQQTTGDHFPIRAEFALQK